MYMVPLQPAQQSAFATASEASSINLLSCSASKLLSRTDETTTTFPWSTTENGESNAPLPNVNREHVAKCAEWSTVGLGRAMLGRVR